MIIPETILKYISCCTSNCNNNCTKNCIKTVPKTVQKTVLTTVPKTVYKLYLTVPKIVSKTGSWSALNLNIKPILRLGNDCECWFVRVCVN